MTMKKFSVDLELGQEIIVGKNNERAKITKIEYHEKSGVINLHTTKGPIRGWGTRDGENLSSVQ